VQACGVCHSDVLTKEGGWPGHVYPCVPGHEVAGVQLIFGRRSIQGWASGIPTDSEDTLRFAELTGVRPMIEKYPGESGRGGRADDEREGGVLGCEC